VVFQQFQPGHGYEQLPGGTSVLSDDTSDFVVGSQSLKIATKGDGEQSRTCKKSAGPYDFTDRDLRITFKVEGMAHLNDFSIFLSSDNLSTNNAHYPISIPVQPFIADGEWASVTISWGDLANNFAAGSIKRSAINYVEFRYEDDNEGAVTFHVNEIAAVPQPSNGVVSIIFDDGWESTYTKGRAYMDRYGMRGSVCIIRDVVGTTNYATLAQLKALQQISRWDVCAHADTVANHNAGYGTLEDSVVEEELEGIKTWLIENGFKDRDLFVWPKGSFTASQMPLALEFFNGIRGTTGGRGGSAGPHEMFPPAENGRLRCFLIGNETTAAEVETALNQCATHKSWLIIAYHRIVNSGASTGVECNEATFKEMIDKVKASGLAVKTISEVLES
jgi:polysaccharide deacetylase